jgi:hypothetical protein
VQVVPPSKGSPYQLIPGYKCQAHAQEGLVMQLFTTEDGARVATDGPGSFQDMYKKWTKPSKAKNVDDITKLYDLATKLKQAGVPIGGTLLERRTLKHMAEQQNFLMAQKTRDITVSPEAVKKTAAREKKLTAAKVVKPVPLPPSTTKCCGWTMWISPRRATSTSTTSWRCSRAL